jgi:hypothetical protein
MPTAAKILIVGGLANLLFAFVFEFIVSRAQLVSDDGEEVAALDGHVGSLWEGVMLLALVFAVTLSPLRQRIEAGAAGIIVIGSILQAAAIVIAWRNGTGSPFAARGAAYQLAAINTLLAVAGLAVLTVGVLKGF